MEMKLTLEQYQTLTAMGLSDDNLRAVVEMFTPAEPDAEEGRADTQQPDYSEQFGALKQQIAALTNMVQAGNIKNSEGGAQPSVDQMADAALLGLMGMKKES